MTSEAPAPETLGERLTRQIDQFDPFEALRLAELENPATPLAARGAVTLRHMATPLARHDRSGDVELAFVGLIGPLGPLPPAYTEIAVHARKSRNFALPAFFDVFLSRVAGLFVRAAEKYRLPALVARHGSGGADRITAALYALIGLGLPALRGRMATPDDLLLPYAGLLAADVRSAAGLEIFLADQLGLPVRIRPFQARWLPIALEEQTRMRGASPAFGRLGVDAVAGQGIWDASSTFRVVIGPIGHAEFVSLAPGGSRMAEIVELVRFYVDAGLDFDVQVILRKEDVPESRLGDAPPSLGWNAWLRQLPAERDADQPVYVPTR